MGLYLNKNNNFKMNVFDDVFIDKSLLISFTNKCINEPTNNCICVTRPRRFGKSMGLNMLKAYYSKGCNSLDLFKNLKISIEESFETYLNKHSVIYVNILDVFNNGEGDFIKSLNKCIVDELKEKYKDILDDNLNIANSVKKVYIKTNEKFIFLIDEWDYPFTRAFKEVVDAYMKLLSGLFKGDTEYLSLAYMTGVLPIKKYSATSDLNNFNEYSMIKPDELAPFFGFTDNEVKELCNKYDMNYKEIKDWYDGYKLIRKMV